MAELPTAHTAANSGRQEAQETELAEKELREANATATEGVGKQPTTCHFEMLKLQTRL
jgi:hypothetical protein